MLTLSSSSLSFLMIQIYSSIWVSMVFYLDLIKTQPHSPIRLSSWGFQILSVTGFPVSSWYLWSRAVVLALSFFLIASFHFFRAYLPSLFWHLPISFQRSLADFSFPSPFPPWWVQGSLEWLPFLIRYILINILGLMMAKLKRFLLFLTTSAPQDFFFI